MLFDTLSALQDHRDHMEAVALGLVEPGNLPTDFKSYYANADAKHVYNLITPFVHLAELGASEPGMTFQDSFSVSMSPSLCFVRIFPTLGSICRFPLGDSHSRHAYT